MDPLKTRQFLIAAAELSQKQEETISKTDVIKKLKELKYLSSQKRVPKLTLRKEIIHLESKLKGLFQLEKKLLAERKREKAKAAALKRQITILKKKLAAVEDKDMQKKVDKFSQLLGDHLAKKGVKEDVALAQQIAPQLKSPLTPYLIEEEKNRLASLSQRLEALKHELGIHKELEKKNPQTIKILEEKIAFIEGKLSQFQQQPQLLFEPAPIVKEEGQVKHKFIFAGPVTESKEEFVKELPLPPPPKGKI